MREDRGSRRGRLKPVLTALAALSALVAVGAPAAATPTAASRRSSFAMSAGAHPIGITAGPDGNLWFTEFRGDRIGRITPEGSITEYSAGLRSGSGLWGIASGPDGNLWFAEGNADRIGRITPEGVITQFPAGSAHGPSGIAAGPDANMWFTVPSWPGVRIGRITTAGAVTGFSKGFSTDSVPLGIAAGPDGNMWFTDYEGARIGRISPGTGAVTEYARGADLPRGIAAGPDGNMWFADEMGAIGRVSPAGVITTFVVRGAEEYESAPLEIAAGPDGNLWYTEATEVGDLIGRITPAGVMTEFSEGLSQGAGPWGIAAGPDGNMWFTESYGDRIGRITPAGRISEFPPTAQILSSDQRGTRVVVRVRCPSGAPWACGGTLRLGKTGNGGARRLPTVAAGRRASVVVPMSRAWRRLVARRGTLAVRLWLLPTPHSVAAALAQPITLRAIRPRTPAVTG